MRNLLKSVFTIVLATALYGWFTPPEALAAGNNVVPPKGSQCKKKYPDDTDNYCTFPDGSKWLCDENLDNCIRLSKTLPGKRLTAPAPVKKAPATR
jgi:hypothetical protein